MPGPAPKDASQRRRRNAPERGEWIDLAEKVDEPALPELPEREFHKEIDPRGEWHPATIETWEAWRHEPATLMWGQSEIAGAKQLIRIVDEANWTGKEWNEVRLRETSLGLNATGKKQLRWRPAAEQSQQEQSPAPVTKLSNVRRLKAV